MPGRASPLRQQGREEALGKRAVFASSRAAFGLEKRGKHLQKAAIGEKPERPISKQRRSGPHFGRYRAGSRRKGIQEVFKKEAPKQHRGSQKVCFKTRRGGKKVERSSFAKKALVGKAGEVNGWFFFVKRSWRLASENLWERDIEKEKGDAFHRGGKETVKKHEAQLAVLAKGNDH